MNARIGFDSRQNPVSDGYCHGVTDLAVAGGFGLAVGPVVGEPLEAFGFERGESTDFGVGEVGLLVDAGLG